MRDGHLPFLQSKSSRSVHGSMHQMRSRGYDHLLDVMYIERRPLRHVPVQIIAAQLHRTKIQIWREHGRWHEVEESIYGASIRSSADRRESTQIFLTGAQ